MNDVTTNSAVFSPRRPWWGGDLQTIRSFTHQARDALTGFADCRVRVTLEDGTGDCLVGALNRPAEDKGRPLVMLIHGISGSESSCYMRLTAAYFLARGYPVLRLNLRGAGPSRALCKLQYHAGSSADLATMFKQLPGDLTKHGILPVGFSLGGNVLLKFLGLAGGHDLVKRAATVSAPIDLAESSRSLKRWRNFGYHRFILTRLKRHCTAPGALLSAEERRSIRQARSLWEFDDGFTAKRNGYDGAQHYYQHNAAKTFLGQIDCPTLMIHAKDDPFVPVAPYVDGAWRRNDNLQTLLPESGGHLGFHDPAGFWHLRQIERFFQQA